MTAAHSHLPHGAPERRRPDGARLVEAPTDRLYTRCLFCRCEFPHSTLFSRVPPGDRLAYDPVRARIWSICGRCKRWNLIPLEERLDAVDELERTVHDRAALLAATANIALYETDDLTIIRIGRAPLIERAAWRYGRELIARDVAFHRRRTQLATFTTGALARAGERLGAWKLDRDWGPSGAADILRWQRFGNIAWEGRSGCLYCGSVLHTLHFDSSWWLYPRMENSQLVVGVPCTRCDPWTPRNVFDVTGEEAHVLLRRALAYQHIAGASERDVQQATKLIDHVGSAERLLGQLSSGRSTLWGLGRVPTIALEIAANQVAERHQLQLHLHSIEAEWRIEESFARIVDDELS